jgi:hypothetical protein
MMRTSSIVPPPVSPLDPAIPPPVPDGSISMPLTVVPSSRSTTSALVSVSVGRLLESALCSVSDPTVSVAASPIRL